MNRAERGIHPGTEYGKVRRFTPRRVIGEVGGSIAEVGASIVLPAWLVVGVDAVTAELNARKGSSSRRRLRSLEAHPPKAPTLRRLDVENLWADQSQMIPEVNNWEQQQLDALRVRAQESEQAEKREKIHMIAHPIAMGVARLAAFTAVNIPHAGAGLAALESIGTVVAANPAVLIPAFVGAVTNPVGWLLIASIMGAAFYASWQYKRYQHALTERFEQIEPALVRQVAAAKRAEYGDDHLSPAEVAFRTARALGQAGIGWLQSIGKPTQ